MCKLQRKCNADVETAMKQAECLKQWSTDTFFPWRDALSIMPHEQHDHARMFQTISFEGTFLLLQWSTCKWIVWQDRTLATHAVPQQNCTRCLGLNVHTFVAFWLWSNVTFVLSVTIDMSSLGDMLVTSFFKGRLHAEVQACGTEAWAIRPRKTSSLTMSQISHEWFSFNGSLLGAASSTTCVWHVRLKPSDSGWAKCKRLSPFLICRNCSSKSIDVEHVFQQVFVLKGWACNWRKNLPYLFTPFFSFPCFPMQIAPWETRTPDLEVNSLTL